MKIEYNTSIYTVPDFLIIGAAKAGTTSLHNYLEMHPDIYMSSPKETWFFSYFGEDIHSNNKQKKFKKTVYSDLDEYSKLFLGDEKKLQGESSPTYLLFPDTTIENIKKIYGEDHKKLKIIVSLRQPVERMWSQYNHFRSQLREELPFEEAIKPDLITQRLENNCHPFFDYLGGSYYSYAVNRFMEEFPHIYILFFENFKQNPSQIVNEVSQFIGAYPYSFDTKKTYNKGGVLKEKLSFLRPLYKWYLNKNNVVRSGLRKVLPLSIRKSIHKFISRLLLRKSTLDKELNHRLTKELFKEDIENLQKVCSVHKKKIEKWLNT